MEATSRVQLRQTLEEQLVLVREAYARSFSGRPGQEIHEHLLHSGGKFLRARLTLLSTAHGLGDGCNRPSDHDSWEAARQVALAIEIVHAGTLYHDDLVDRSSTRRGVPAVHVQSGPRAASIGGGQLLLRANSLISDLPQAMRRRWGVAAIRVADGQLAETERAGRSDLSESGYLGVARRKTASLFELAASLGGEIGGTNEPELGTLRRVGIHLGTAFQLFDDVDDFETHRGSHRNRCNDLRERIYTLPVIYGLELDDGGDSRLRELLVDDGKPMSSDRIDEARAILIDCGAIERARDRAFAELSLAHGCVRALANDGIPGEFRTLLEGAVPASSLARLDELSYAI